LADGISLHTVNQDDMPQYKSEYYYNYENMIRNIIDVTQSKGFDGYIIADELNYRTHHYLKTMNMKVIDEYPTDPIVAAKNISRMMVINRGIGVFVGTSGTNAGERPLEGKILKDYNRMMYNLEPCDIVIEFETSSDYIRYYSFIDEMGSKYIAVWNDIAAEEKYKTVDCSLKIEGEEFQNAVWQDPYYSITQKLNTESSDGLQINDLLIPDYPIFIKLY
jgi:hypothetical protein